MVLLKKLQGKGTYQKGKGKHKLEFKFGKDKEGFCYYCGKKINEDNIVGVCNEPDRFFKVAHPTRGIKQTITKSVGSFKPILCKSCAKKCKKCKKIYCPAHINNHKCV
ncbi:MAG: hypothetical protein KKH88_02140 [Nanoarchaeota archaeon]|nr:hypothetical protein [Nanoarchaeota archaeon]